jgi:hypothetical protein
LRTPWDRGLTAKGSGMSTELALDTSWQKTNSAHTMRMFPSARLEDILACYSTSFYSFTAAPNSNHSRSEIQNCVMYSGSRGSVIHCGTMLQAVWLLFRFLMR